MNIAYIPLLIGIALNATAQLMLKTGMDKIGHFEFAMKNIWPIALQVALNPYIVIGLACYGISVVVWLIGLSRVDVSVAYPLLSLGYVFITFAAYFILHENVSALRIVGVAVILVGIFLVTRSAA